MRDIVQAHVELRTFIAHLVSDFDGLRVPTGNPYGPPAPWPNANKIDINVLRTDPDGYAQGGQFTADEVTLDGTVNPEVVEFSEVIVDVPAD